MDCTVHNIQLFTKTTRANSGGEVHQLRCTADREHQGVTVPLDSTQGGEHSGVESWDSFTELPPQATGYVVRVQDTPSFKDFLQDSMSAVICYRVKEDEHPTTHQVNIPTLHLTATDVARGIHAPYRNQSAATMPSAGPEQPDLLTVMLTSKHAALYVHTVHPCSAVSLTTALEEQLHFERVSQLTSPRSLLVHFGRAGETPGLAGVLVDATRLPQEHRLDVYTRNTSQLYLLLHCLYTVLPMNSVIYSPKLEKPKTKDILHAIEMEHDFLSSFIKECDLEGNNHERALAFRKQLSKLEFRTDQLLMGQAQDET